MQGISGVLARDVFDSPFKDVWNKWDVDLRTTNRAEAFHNRLNITIGRDHPDMRTLLEKLIDFEAKSTLRWIQAHLDDSKHLHKKDRERRENIEEGMRRFAWIYQLREATTCEIEDNCKYISRYVIRKAI